jgi:hypothetical protein
VTRADRRIAAVVAVVVAVALAVSLAVIWRHRHDARRAAAARYALTHSLSYRYGERAFYQQINTPHLPTSASGYCRVALSRAPTATFAGFSSSVAASACIDTFHVVLD